MIECNANGLVDLCTVKAALSDEQWASDPRLLLFGVRCARRALDVAIRGGIPVAEVTSKAIDTLDRYANSDATIGEIAVAARAAITHQVPVQHITEHFAAALGYSVASTQRAGECARELADYAATVHGFMVSSGQGEGVDRRACFLYAKFAELQRQYTDLVDLFGVVANERDPGRTDV